MPGPGILSSILDVTGKRADARVAQSNEMEATMRDLQTKTLMQSIYATDPETGQPKLSPQEADEAWSRIEKLNTHNKNAKDIIAKARDITAKIFGVTKPNPAMAGRAQGQTADALAGGQGGSLIGPVQDPNAGTPQAADADQGAKDAYTTLPPPPVKSSAATPAPGPSQALTPPPRLSRSPVDLMRAGAPANPNYLEKQKEQRANEEWTRREEIQNKAKLEQIEATAKSHGDKKIAQYTGDDGKLHMVFQGADGTKYESDSEGKVRPYASRFSPGTHVSVTDAKELADNLGQQFLDQAGNPLDINKLNIGQELVAISGGLPNRFQVVTQNRVTTTANNQVMVSPALERGNPEATTVVGQAQVPRVGTSQQPVVDAEGNLNLMTTQTTSTPQTAQPPTAPVGTAPKGGTNQPSSPPAATTPKAGTTQVVPGVLQPSQYTTQRSTAVPVRAAGVQLFGSMDHPEVESMMSFADLADDPKARERIGTAARMIINDLTAADKSAGMGAQILGTGASIHGGDIWGALKNWSGLTQTVSKQQVMATQKAIDALPPRELRALNQIMAAYGTVVGLRSLTKGGAYKFSTDSMERELPIPGVSDVNSSASYNNKLAKIANEVVEGTKGISDTILPEKKFFQEKANQLNALGQGRNSAGLPNPPAKSSTGTVRYVEGTDVYNIPSNLEADFKKAHPNAKVSK